MGRTGRAYKVEESATVYRDVIYYISEEEYDKLSKEEKELLDANEFIEGDESLIHRNANKIPSCDKLHHLLTDCSFDMEVVNEESLEDLSNDVWSIEGIYCRHAK